MPWVTAWVAYYPSSGVFQENKKHCVWKHGRKLKRSVLVEVGKEVDPEGVLLIQLVAIGVLHCFLCETRDRVLQKNVPEKNKNP